MKFLQSLLCPTSSRYIPHPRPPSREPIIIPHHHINHAQLAQLRFFLHHHLTHRLLPPQRATNPALNLYIHHLFLSLLPRGLQQLPSRVQKSVNVEMSSV